MKLKTKKRIAKEGLIIIGLPFIAANKHERNILKTMFKIFLDCG